MVVSFLPAGWRAHHDRFLPIVLYGGRQFVYAGEECRKFPHVRLGERLVPGGHSGIADAGANCVKHVPFRIIGRMKDETWRRWIERFLQGRGLPVEAAMAKRAIHGVDLYPLDKVLIGRRHRIVEVGSMTFHRSIECAHGDLLLQLGRLRVGVGRYKAEQGGAKAGNQQNQNGDDNPQNEVAHFISSESPGNLCSVLPIYNRNRAQEAAERLSVSVQTTSLTHQVRDFGQEKLLLRRRKRNWRIERRQADDGTIEIVKRFFVNDRGNFSGQTSGARVFVQNDHFVGLLNGGGNRLAIERRDRTQVDDFDFDSFFAQAVRSFERGIQHGGIGNDAEMTALARDPRLSDWNDVVIFGAWNFFLDSSVQILVLKKDHGIVVADRRLDQSLGIVGRRRADDLQSGRVHEPHLWILRVEWPAMHIAAAWTTNHQRGGRSPAVVRLRGHVDDLIEGAADEVHELELSYGTQSGESSSEGSAYDGRLRNGRIDHALGAEAVDEAIGDFEGSTVDTDILAQTKDGWVALHFLPDSLADGFEICDAGHEQGSVQQHSRQLSAAESSLAAGWCG